MIYLTSGNVNAAANTSKTGHQRGTQKILHFLVGLKFILKRHDVEMDPRGVPREFETKTSCVTKTWGSRLQVEQIPK